MGVMDACGMGVLSVILLAQQGDSEGIMRGHPMMVAHRGFSAKYPENTLASVRAAVELGADFVEIDTWLSKDAVPVVMHDDDLERTTGQTGTIKALTVEELKKLDVGSWKGPEFAGERIPTLDEVLQVTQGRSILVIEVKQQSMEKEILQVLQSRQALHDVLIFSFYPDVVAQFTALEPRIPSIWLLSELPEDPKAQRELLDIAGPMGASGVGVSLVDLKAPFVRMCHLAGFSLAVWTVDPELMQKRMIDLGVDYIISNQAEQLLKLLGK